MPAPDDVRQAELRALACDKAQGFLIAKPTTIDTFEQLLANGARW
jgi:EAL domain-containing protein (putative c-di-GMP-specific phosphodiesterase class I)